MKILVICQYYYPEPFRLPDICETLVQDGHDVTVVTGTPNYPMGEIYPGYENGQRMDEVLNGVKVHRCVTAPRKTGTLNRLRNYFSYPRASKKYVRDLHNDFDVVFINQLSPVMMAKAGIWYAKKHHVRSVLYCLDLWPESLCAGGIKNGSVIYKVFKFISKKMYCSVDKILITSRSFHNYLHDMFGIPEQNIHYLPQYAEAQFLSLPEKKQSEIFNLVFAGNIGTAQNVDTIIDAAKLLVDQKVMFHIVGDGIELDNLKKQVNGLQNVIFYGRKPLEDMPMYYEMADAMLVTLTDDPILSLTLPGKVQTYMAAGKPIIGAIDGETRVVIEAANCGFCGKAGDTVELSENVKRFIQSKDRVAMGQNARKYYEENFEKRLFMDKLESMLLRKEANQ